jgi:hypothetical protein
MTGWRKRTIVEMAKQVGYPIQHEEWRKATEEFAALVREDEREKYKWDVHSCGPTCTKVGCVAVRKAVEAEREACAKVAEKESAEWYDNTGVGDAIAAVIRARGQA